MMRKAVLFLINNIYIYIYMMRKSGLKKKIFQ